MNPNNSQLVDISYRAFLWPLLAGAIVVLLNIQWLQMYQLLNAPQADSLVYLTEAYNDYWAMRNLEFPYLFEKYITWGNQHVSPMLWWLAAIFFFLFGLDPVNAYLVIALAYLVWISGVVYLAWNIYPDAKYATACGLMAAFLPSVAFFGLRHFMLDFVAAAPFIWSTAFLIKSDLLTKRSNVMIYGALAAVTILLRTTSVVYFFSHAAIIIIQSVMRKRHPHYGNMALAVIVVVVGCGWFILPNLQRILDYYGYWAAQAHIANPDITFVDNLNFYWDQLRGFHMKNGFTSVLILTGIGIPLLTVKLYFQKIERGFEARQWLERILIIVALALIPTICLSLYSSRAASVDYPFIAAYMLLPLLLWRAILIKSNSFWIPAMILVLALGYAQAKFLIGAPRMSSSNGDFRERDVLKVIFADAENRGLNTVKVGNTAIHQHNSLSYQYWTLANYFPHWRGRVEGVPIGRTDSAKELAKMNSGANYVITLENYHADWHPNNKVAPAANDLLMEHYGMKALPVQFALPDGTTLKILVRQESLSYPQASSDGWHENGVPITIWNPDKKPLPIRVKGKLTNLSGKPSLAILTMYSKDNPAHRLRFDASSDVVDHTFLVPPEFVHPSGHINMILNSSWAGRPVGISHSTDTRNLAFRELKLTIDN
jgi:hypothetical protein